MFEKIAKGLEKGSLQSLHYYIKTLKSFQYWNVPLLMELNVHPALRFPLSN